MVQNRVHSRSLRIMLGISSISASQARCILLEISHYAKYSAEEVSHYAKYSAEEVSHYAKYSAEEVSHYAKYSAEEVKFCS